LANTRKVCILQKDESAIEFANRVKHAIAVKGGLVDLEWDGQLKRSKVSEKQIAQQRRLYAERLERTSGMPSSPSSSSMKISSENFDDQQDATTRSNLINTVSDEHDLNALTRSSRDKDILSTKHTDHIFDRVLANGIVDGVVNNGVRESGVVDGVYKVGTDSILSIDYGIWFRLEDKLTIHRSMSGIQ
jgi:hypothetical protein